MTTAKCKNEHKALQEIQRSRTNMAMLHFIMLAPKWSISLFLFLAARHHPIPSTQDAVEGPIKRMHAAYDMERRSYQQCAIDSALSLQVELQTLAYQEYQRVNKIHQLNRNSIDEARRTKDQCQGSATNSQSLLLQWQDQGNNVDLIENKDICSQEQRESVLQLLGGEYKLREDEVTSIWDQHFQDTLHSYKLIQEYAEERFQYDYNYFVGLRIEPALNMLATMTTIDSLNLSVDDIAIKDRVNAALLRLREVLNRAESAISALKERIALLSTSLEAFYIAYLDCYNRLVQGVIFVQDILPPGVAMPGFFNIEGLPIADTMMPALPDLAVFDVDFSSAYLLFDDTVGICMQAIQDVIHDLVARSEQALRGALNNINEALLAVLTLEDYNPPVFVGSQGTVSTLTDEVALQKNRSRSALDQSKFLLANLTSVKIPEGESARSYIAVEPPTESFSNQSSSFAYLNPKFPQIFFPKFLSYFLSLLSSYTWIIEVIIQAIRLWRLEATYSKAAIPDLPEINYNNSDETGNDEDETEQFKTQQLFLLTLQHHMMAPRMVLATILTPILLVSMALWYPHVRSNCQVTRDGTFLANRFLAPIFINNANTDGNAYYLKAELQCYQTQREICRQMQAQTLSQYQIALGTFMDLQVEYNQSKHVVQILQDCISQNTTTKMEDSCCGIKGYASCTESSHPGFCPVDLSTTPDWPTAYRPLNEYLADPACGSESTWPTTLVEPKFDCEHLSRLCEDIPCEGVDKIALRKETVETDCQVELYALDVCFFVLWTVFHAVTMHLISTLLFNGVRTLGWRRLYPEGIVFHTKLREDGTLVTGNDQDERAERIALAIRRFELAGRLQIAVGLSIVLVWAIIVLR